MLPRYRWPAPPHTLIRNDKGYSMLKILHTSDWHLGRALYGRKRYEEFEQFLRWMTDTIRTHAVDVLLIAGDIFDTTTPSNRAQQLYYRFLGEVGRTACRHVVIVAGNHDSPSFLDAPRELLKALDVHVMGAISDNPDDEVLLLRGADNTPELLVCAVPYLRDRDIRTAEAGESLADKEQKMLSGIRAHYAAVSARAEALRSSCGVAVPIIGTGHLFTAGGQTVEGDGVRDLYVGSIAHVPAGIFPALLDYVALGHLHVPQRVGDSDRVRYSGSPLAMGFGEARQQKSVCLLTLPTPPAPTAIAINSNNSTTALQLELLPVPVFQALERLSGDWPALQARLLELVAQDAASWLEITYTGTALMPDLREQLDALIAGTALEILRVRNSQISTAALARNRVDEALEDLDVNDVFERCLLARDVPEAQQQTLREAYAETLAGLQQQDHQA
jgi:exonuclease SbcD